MGGLAWWLQLQPALHADGSPLSQLPRQIGAWQSVDLPIGSTVEAVLRADFNLQRAYTDPAGPTRSTIWLYIGYYGTARGGRPEHTPRGCYTGAGWGIAASGVVDIAASAEAGSGSGAGTGSRLRANEYRVERERERRLVLFWYRSHRQTGLLGGFDQNWDRLVGRLLDGRADGALVRISTAIVGEGDGGGETAARSRLTAFAAMLDPLLAEHWPIETSPVDPG